MYVGIMTYRPPSKYYCASNQSNQSSRKKYIMRKYLKSRKLFRLALFILRSSSC